MKNVIFFDLTVVLVWFVMQLYMVDPLLNVIFSNSEDDDEKERVRSIVSDILYLLCINIIIAHTMLTSIN